MNAIQKPEMILVQGECTWSFKGAEKAAPNWPLYLFFCPKSNEMLPCGKLPIKFPCTFSIALQKHEPNNT